MPTQSTERAQPRPLQERIHDLGKEVFIGLMLAFAVLPACLSSGVLVFAPLGSDAVARGAAAGLFGVAIGGAVAALVMRSSFVISSSRSQLALVQASLAAALMGRESFADHPTLAISALATCVALAGLMQALFAVAGVARIIRYTPHTVLAGFTNGAALAIAISQLKPFIDAAMSQGGALPFIVAPLTLSFIVLLAAFMIGLGRLTSKIPGPMTGLILGIAIYYVAKQMAPGLEPGRTLGTLPFNLPSDLPLLELIRAMPAAQFRALLSDLAVVSLAIAVLGTIESLLVLRTAQNLSGESPRPVRDLLAQGAGNLASGLCGGLAVSASPGLTRAAFRYGARTRVVALTIGLATPTFAMLVPNLFGMIPVAVLSALLLQNAFQNFDRWSLRHVLKTIHSEPSPQRRRACYDLAVVFTVMIVTVTVTAVAGILIGIALACLIFIANMSRPVIHAIRSGEVLFSKRVRPESDNLFLKDTAMHRTVLELQGVLFFGNADDLYNTASDMLAQSDVIVLDMRGVMDIDISGSNVLRDLIERSRRRNKDIHFCNVAPEFADALQEITAGGKNATVYPDLDSALEAIEERSLMAAPSRQIITTTLPLEQHDFLHGVAPAERALLETYMTLTRFQPGAILGHEGDPADRLWIIVGGSVSIRLRVPDARGTRRLVSLAPGTTVGEMALLQSGVRSASIIADDDVTCYELRRDAFDRLVKDQPALGAILLANLARQLARNLLRASEDMRRVTG